MSRPPLMFFVAALAVLIGMAGLVRGAAPQSSAASPASSSTAPIVVGGAYVRQSANDVNVAAYFTVYNTTAAPDQLTSVTSGAGELTSLHTETGGVMSATSGVTIPAKGSVTLSPGQGHVMIEKLYDALKPGQTVNFVLTFAHAGQVVVTAPVIAIGAPAPTVGPTASAGPTATASAGAS